MHPRRSSRRPRRPGLIEPIGDWVIDALSAQIGSLARRGARAVVRFNVSPRQLLRPDFAAKLGERLRVAGVDAALSRWRSRSRP